MKMGHIANINKIEWLLKDQTGYRISKLTGIGESTINRWTSGNTPLEKMRLEHAIKLTDCAEALELEQLAISRWKGGHKLSDWLNGLMLEALKELPGLDMDELVKMPKEVLMVELLSNTKKQSVVNGPEDWNDSDLYEIDLYGLRMDDFRDTLKEYEEGAKWVQPIKDYLATR